MVGPLGVFAGGTMATTRDERVDRMGASAPPDSEKPKAVNRTRTVGANAPPTPSRWIRNVNDYDRRERGEYQVIRFG
jgi:hypothetical protein